MIVELVGRRLRKHWLGQQEHFKDVVEGLLSVRAVQLAILAWWKFLVATLVQLIDKGPESYRALEYTKARREKRFEEQDKFSHEPSIVAKAKELLPDRQDSKCRSDLISVFLAIDEVSLVSERGCSWGVLWARKKSVPAVRCFARVRSACACVYAFLSCRSRTAAHFLC